MKIPKNVIWVQDTNRKYGTHYTTRIKGYELTISMNRTYGIRRDEYSTYYSYSIRRTQDSYKNRFKYHLESTYGHCDSFEEAEKAVLRKLCDILEGKNDLLLTRKEYEEYREKGWA